MGAALFALTWLALVGLLIELLFPEWLCADGERQFTGHRDEVPVQRLVLDGPHQRSEFSVAGFVTNCGAYPWRIHALEFRFLNPDGSLLEVRQRRIDRPFVVGPGGEHAFRVSLGRLLEPMIQADLRARVQEAGDGSRPPKRDWSPP